MIAADTKSVRAFDVETGKEIWNIDAAEPRNIVADGKIVAMITGRIKRGEKAIAVVLDAASGTENWRREYSWLIETTRTVLAKGLLVYEVSSLNDHDAGNGIHVVSAATGEPQWSKEFPPGMNHARQARAMFVNDDLWILHGGKTNTSDKENIKRSPTSVSALDPLTGKVRKSYPAGMAHCFPPVCTTKYVFAGELDMNNHRGRRRLRHSTQCPPADRNRHRNRRHSLAVHCQWTSGYAACDPQGIVFVRFRGRLGVCSSR